MFLCFYVSTFFALYTYIVHHMPTSAYRAMCWSLHRLFLEQWAPRLTLCYPQRSVESNHLGHPCRLDIDCRWRQSWSNKVRISSVYIGWECHCSLAHPTCQAFRDTPGTPLACSYPRDGSTLVGSHHVILAWWVASYMCLAPWPLPIDWDSFWGTPKPRNTNKLQTLEPILCFYVSIFLRLLKFTFVKVHVSESSRFTKHVFAVLRRIDCYIRSSPSLYQIGTT
jgi:hypothetical protein